MKPPLPADKTDVEHEADYWLVALNENELPAASRRSFVKWLKRSPTHVEELFRGMELQSLIAGCDAETFGDAPLDALPGNVVSLPRARSSPLATDRPNAWPRWAQFAAAAALTLTIGAPFETHRTPALEFSTRRGDVREFTLPDSSSITLDTNSSINVVFNAHERLVRVLNGQVLVKAQHDSRRPMRVVARDLVLSDIGTTFDIYQRSTDTVISVIDGEVSVYLRDEKGDDPDGALGNRITTVTGGHRVAIQRNADVVRVIAEQTAAENLSWTSNKLDFDEWTLGEIAAEFNRYNDMQIEISPAARPIRLSGNFSLHDPRSFLSAIENMNSLQITSVDAQHTRIDVNVTSPHQTGVR